MPGEDELRDRAREKATPIAGRKRTRKPREEEIERKWMDGLPECAHHTESLGNSIEHQAEKGRIAAEAAAATVRQINGATDRGDKEGVRHQPGIHVAIALNLQSGRAKDSDEGSEAASPLSARLAYCCRLLGDHGVLNHIPIQRPAGSRKAEDNAMRAKTLD